MFNATNYTVWAMRMKVGLRVHKVWKVIESSNQDSEKNDIATALLFQSISESLILQLGEQDTTKGIWEAIKTRHMGADHVREARLQTLNSEFDRLVMKDSDIIDNFAGNLFEISSRSAALGEVIEESKLVKKFLKSLPRYKFIHIIASFEQVLDLNTTGNEDIVGRLKAYEERNGEETQRESQEKLMWSKDKQKKDKQKKDYSKVICYRCDKLGHFAKACPKTTQRQQEGNVAETEIADGALYMHEVVCLNEEKVLPKKYEAEGIYNNIWYLDNGAGNHMTGNKSFFVEMDETIIERVKFGNGSCVEIAGKGSILFVCKMGEQRSLNGIYYTPKLKHNILSLGQPTELQRMDDYLKMFDPCGRLLIQVTRTPNRLYKANMQIEKTMCLQANIDETSWRWHQRLRHVNFRALKSMADKKMVFKLPSTKIETETCESCLAGKQTRNFFCQIPTSEKGDANERFKRFKAMIEQQTGKSIKTFRTDRGGEFRSTEFNMFCEENGILRHLTTPYTPQQNGVVERHNRTLMEMMRSMMKTLNLPNYLWGEAKPNDEHLRIFGCLAHVKVEAAHLRKLDEISRDLVHLGIEPDSKLIDCLIRKRRKLLLDEMSCLLRMKVRIGVIEIIKKMENQDVQFGKRRRYICRKRF
uniref:Polyprotein n=1 Tax=Boechera divaricarpa TaxID=115915 RepID=B6REL1_9BRAS|nr:polyprotein [Boechera divaricarpa]